MGKRYLIDTNIIIYYLNDAIPKKELDKIEIIFKESFTISILVKIEFLGWKHHTDKGLKESIDFISHAYVYYLDDYIANLTIDLKRKTSIKLADAVIAATAIINNSILVTRNVDDFIMIKDLKMYNPYSTQ